MPLDNLAVWTIPPDWQSGITETLEFLTTVLASPNGAEQRYAYRLTPRRSFEMTFRPARGPTRTLFDMFVERASGSDIYLPLWHDFNVLTHPAAPGTDRLNVGGTNDMEYADCEGVFIQGADPFDFEIAEVASVEPSQVLLTAPIAGTWSPGLRVFPLQRARIETQPQATRKADRAEEVRIKFSLETPNPTSAAVVLSKYAGYPVLERQPNDSTDLTYQYDRIMAELDNQSGRRARVDINAWGSTVQQFTWLLHRRDDHQWMRAFCYQLNGRQYPVLVPTFFADLDVVAPILDNSLTVTRCGYTEFGGPFRNRELIQVSLYSGRNYYARITSAALIGDGSTERLVLDTAFDQVIQPSDIHRVSFLSICRLDQDAIEIVHETDSRGAATATTVFRSLPQDRMTIPPVPPVDSMLWIYSPGFGGGNGSIINMWWASRRPDEDIGFPGDAFPPYNIAGSGQQVQLPDTGSIQILLRCTFTYYTVLGNIADTVRMWLHFNNSTMEDVEIILPGTTSEAGGYWEVTSPRQDIALSKIDPDQPVTVQTFFQPQAVGGNYNTFPAANYPDNVAEPFHDGDASWVFSWWM